MTIELYNNASDSRVLSKTLLEKQILTGTLRQSTSIINPVIYVESQTVLRYNYARIPDFQRYYFIENIIIGPNNFYELHMKVDVLMSFRGDIASWNVIIDKQTLDINADDYIDDGTYIQESVRFNKLYSFSNEQNNYKQFLNDPVYILITAG